MIMTDIRARVHRRSVVDNSVCSSCQGFTLVELMVGMLSGAILVLIISAIMVIPVRSMKGNRAYARLRQEMAYASRLMSRDIRITAWGDIDDDLMDDHVRSGYLFLDYNEENPIIRDENVLYQKEGDTLTRTLNGQTEILISEGLLHFEPSAIHVDGKQGILFALEMNNTETGASIVKSSYIQVRN
ncbi:hypothetical protein P4C99_11040 [Pontiellaceae bacterium B1224]|nr:hypothetical protein [Pontiellaceae bacterium B1224]